MKYTKYLIDGKFVDLESMQTNNPFLKMPIRILTILVALCGITAITGILPMTIMVDSYRNTKTRLIYFKRNGYKL